jgi:hypothetical protein
MRRNTIIIAALLLALAGIRAWKLSDGPSLQARAPASNEDGEAPAIGASLFDHLFAEGGEVRVPYPFSEVLEKIRVASEKNFLFSKMPAVLQAHLNPVNFAVIPSGRSPVRLAAGTELFREPRVVAGAPTRAVGIGDRIFVAYSEAAHQLEAISFNEAAGRFEFQVVHDYGEGLRPRIAYANRAFCTTCHQNEGPIFPVFPWSETHTNQEIRSRILATLGDKDQYRGISLFVDRVNDLDASIGRTENMLAAQDFWRAGCGTTESDDARRCRSLLILHALSVRGPDPELPTSVRDAASVLPFRNPRLPNRRVLETSTVGSFRSRQSAPESPEELLARIRKLPPELDPSTPRGRKESGRFRNFRVGSLLGPVIATKVDDYYLDEALRRLSAEELRSRVDRALTLRGEDDPFTAVALRPCTVVRALLPEEAAQILKNAQCFEGPLQAATLQADPRSRREMNPGLARIQTTCGSCHDGRNQSELDFLSGSNDEEVCGKIRDWLPRIRERLQPGADGAMPPPRSKEAALLRASGGPAALWKDLNRIERGDCR